MKLNFPRSITSVLTSYDCILDIICSRGTGEDEFIQGADELIQAFNDGDEDAAREVLSRPFVKFMDNCVRKSCILYLLQILNRIKSMHSL